MYINVATLAVPDQVQSPVEGDSIVGVANTIQTATLEKANSTERLLEKLLFLNQLLIYLLVKCLWYSYCFWYLLL